MANDRKYLSAEEEAKLLKPIDEYIGKIQKKIDALRVDGSDKVQALKTHIALTKEDKNYTKEEQAEIILWNFTDQNRELHTIHHLGGGNFVLSGEMIHARQI